MKQGEDDDRLVLVSNGREALPELRAGLEAIEHKLEKVDQRREKRALTLKRVASSINGMVVVTVVYAFLGAILDKSSWGSGAKIAFFLCFAVTIVFMFASFVLRIRNSFREAEDSSQYNRLMHQKNKLLGTDDMQGSITLALDEERLRGALSSQGDEAGGLSVVSSREPGS